VAERLAAEALGEPVPLAIEASDLEARVREAVADSRRKVVALDDDPTGVQTVHDVAVLARWDPATLANELRQPGPLFFVLTNSRSLPESQAVELNREIAANLQAASRESGVSCVVASRSDSTLRGHFPAETDALAETLGGVDGVLICPAFFEGGRVTAGDVHFLREEERLIPVADTEFARDATFGYQARSLPDWVREKSSGRVVSADVTSLSLRTIRLGGPDAVVAQLRAVRGGQYVVVNALDYPDLWVVTLGLLQAEAEGKRFLYRCAASFVRARAGIDARPLLTRDDLLGGHSARPARAVVIVGSHVRRTSEQLDHLLAAGEDDGDPVRAGRIVDIECSVPAVLRGERDARREVERVVQQADEALERGATPVIYTSRQVERAGVDGELAVARQVSNALVDIVQGFTARPDFVIGKGGITSSDVGTRGLETERAIVLGQIRPGVPVWRLGPESRFPGLPYVVFPGNVGGPETLVEVVVELIG
jgi:uncharacterized protein YgbK (DUF1537 family)